MQKSWTCYNDPIAIDLLDTIEVKHFVKYIICVNGILFSNFCVSRMQNTIYYWILITIHLIASNILTSNFVFIAWEAMNICKHECSASDRVISTFSRKATILFTICKSQSCFEYFAKLTEYWSISNAFYIPFRSTFYWDVDFVTEEN